MNKMRSKDTASTESEWKAYADMSASGWVLYPCKEDYTEFMRSLYGTLLSDMGDFQSIMNRL